MPPTTSTPWSRSRRQRRAPRRRAPCERERNAGSWTGLLVAGPRAASILGGGARPAYVGTTRTRAVALLVLRQGCARRLEFPGTVFDIRPVGIALRPLGDAGLGSAARYAGGHIRRGV